MNFTFLCKLYGLKIKKLILCRKIEFSYADQIFQTMNSVSSKNLSLKYQYKVAKIYGIGKFELIF